MIRKSLACLLILGCLGCQGKEGKYLLILQAGPETHEGTARALHALLYATELKKEGYRVALLFDGAGTEWARDLLDPQHPLHDAYAKLHDLGVTEFLCDACSRAFHVRDGLDKAKTVSEFEGHPSLVKWIKAGYLPIVL